MEAATQFEHYQAEMYADRVKLMYRLAPASFLGTLISASILWVVMLEAVQLTSLNLWYALLMLASVGRYGLVKVYFGAPRKSGEGSLWAHRFVVLTALIGIIWGAGGVVLFHAGSLKHQMFLAFAIGIISAAEAISLSSFRIAYLMFLLPAALPFAFEMLLQGGAINVSTGLLALLLVGTMLGMSQRIYATINDTLKLRYENMGLVINLSVAKEKTEEINRQLTREVEERRHAEVVVRKSEQHLRLHIQQTPLAVIESDLEFKITEWNPSAEKMFGYARADALGREAADLVYTEGERVEAKKSLRQVLAGRNTANAVAANLTRGGGSIGCEWYHTPLVDPEGKIIGVVSLAQDITERQRVELMKQEFISTVSHELRTPLTSIRGSLGLVMGGVAGELPSQAQSLLDIANKNSERLLLLINDILDMEKIESGKMVFNLQPQELMPLVQQSLAANQAYAGQFGVRYELKSQAPRAKIRVDSDRLMQVFANLLSNAAKFSPRGDSVDVSVTRNGAAVRVAVADHGAGIPEEFRPRIFQKFSQADSSDTRQKGGTGLGLSITKAITEQMGGAIGFDSKLDAGTTFFVDFPELRE